MHRFENATSFWMGAVTDDAYPDAATLEIAWGALGEPGQSRAIEFTGAGWDDAYAKATAELQRLIVEKRADGYVDKGVWGRPEN